MTDSSTAAFTLQRRKTLEAVVDRILPGIHGPGAAATGVAVAVEGAMQHRSLRGLRAGIERILDLLDAQAGQVHARAFCACTPGAQDALLRALEQDPNPGMRFLFRALIGFSLQGLLGDPIHGGNQQFRGWEAIGLRAEDVRSGLCREPRQP